MWGGLWSQAHAAGELASYCAPQMLYKGGLDLGESHDLLGGANSPVHTHFLPYTYDSSSIAL